MSKDVILIKHFHDAIYHEPQNAKYVFPKFNVSLFQDSNSFNRCFCGKTIKTRILIEAVSFHDKAFRLNSGYLKH